MCNEQCAMTYSKIGDTSGRRRPLGSPKARFAYLLIILYLQHYKRYYEVMQNDLPRPPRLGLQDSTFRSYGQARSGIIAFSHFDPPKHIYTSSAPYSLAGLVRHLHRCCINVTRRIPPPNRTITPPRSGGSHCPSRATSASREHT
jgi:hypothetical protein